MARTVEGTSDGATPTPRPGGGEEAALFAAGATIAARYQVVRWIARGGMGEVYEAHDLELGTRVAIKTIRPERASDPSAVERLKREILAARKVTHPNVVRLFDVGFHVLPDQREIAFFTMELLDGETLEARIRRLGKLAVADAAAIARQLAAALDAAHAAGIVHRDFKSQNVILVGDRAYVTDFGLARVEDGGDNTTTTELAGTPAYMAPEQVTRSRAIGPAADIYALGVVLFEMTTGQLPFERDTPLATAAARIEEAAPSARAFAPELPAAWNAAIARCLRREPAQRFASAGDVVAALGSRAPWPRRRIAIVAGALALAGGGAWLALRGGTAPACGEPALPDLYVDAAARSGGNGSRACPFATVSDALAVTADRRVVHVAAGYYDRAHGERFPLVLRGDVAVRGAGADRTTLVGAGAFDPRPAGGTMGYTTWQATIVAGDDVRTVELADLAIEPGVSQIAADTIGIACTRGASGAPNTTLRALVIGPSYGTGVVVATETLPRESACNLALVDSRLHGGYTGVWQVGCGAGTGRVPTSLHVRGSTFESFHFQPQYPSAGISVYDCVAALSIEDSTFADSDGGIAIIRHAGEQSARVSIVHDRFRNLSRAGVGLALAPDVELRRNSFMAIHGIGELTGKAAAVSLAVDPSGPASVVLRDNQLFENDVGIEVVGTPPIVATSQLDLGRPGDPGGNEVACNAAPKTSSAIGGDVAIRVAAEPGAHIGLAGNRWDHVPPQRASEPVNGLDVLAPATLAPSLDLSGAAASETICNLAR